MYQCWLIYSRISKRYFITQFWVKRLQDCSTCSKENGKWLTTPMRKHCWNMMNSSSVYDAIEMFVLRKLKDELAAPELSSENYMLSLIWLSIDHHRSRQCLSCKEVPANTPGEPPLKTEVSILCSTEEATRLGTFKIQAVQGCICGGPAHSLYLFQEPIFLVFIYWQCLWSSLPQSLGLWWQVDTSD